MIIFLHDIEFLQGHRLLHHDDSHHSDQTIEAAINTDDQAENEDDQHFEHETHSTMRAIILVLAISLHVRQIYKHLNNFIMFRRCLKDYRLE